MENDERAGSEKEKNKDLIYFDRSGKTDWKQKLKGCQWDKDFISEKQKQKLHKKDISKKKY